MNTADDASGALGSAAAAAGSAPRRGFAGCQRCGACCRIEGQVRLIDGDVARLAGQLGLGTGEFIERFTLLARDRRGLVLRDQPDGACIFLQGSDCCVYPARPAQCADFPQRWHNPGWEQMCRGWTGTSAGQSPVPVHHAAG